MINKHKEYVQKTDNSIEIKLNERVGVVGDDGELPVCVGVRCKNAFI